MEEFKNFFADGVLGSEDLENNLDTEELCSYFSQHLGSFREIFAAFEDLSQSVTNVLQATAKSYPESTFKDQFTVRFLLKEVMNQLSAIQHPVDVASDHLNWKISSRTC